ncbi:MAG: MarR family transcriptional regulator [Thermobacillus sp. ZCTH02-B1]|uniref:bifunctional helix-turn-helix transcriptional regulator/GNAT family N-acetyltransferase n=1 Tax=Thermobacillus sp. ZCTH02-B1 TaxID=1858795 RepID=UPI000B585A40|nr:bifunctional helix-turn-helix transcriptional regulator/GNAT family N-acetyltransferase [Thermobacillus sp. ZCTH02-B1]OUM97222.1 MAG: MarR family transcriptional regulator [Thermobacillus sp. ZCTH02-B1]
MPVADSEERIAAVRRFHRFFTRRLGALGEGLLHPPYSLTESRIICEIAIRDTVIAADLAKDLGLDRGYLSRMLVRLEQDGLIRKVPSPSDGRRRLLRLTPEGERVYARLEHLAKEEIAELLGSLSGRDQRRLIQAMSTIERLLGEGWKDSEPYVLRQHEPGDMGWVIHMHGRLYAEEYGWDERFEALVARICSDFLMNYNPDRERCWIAEMNGEIVGSVMLVQESVEVAKLRLLLVDPKARGLGLGKRLVDECIRFARRKGYRKMTLWTNHVLVAARNIYRKAGFVLVKEEPHHDFGPELIGETWELQL